jgi:hypothetical protein
LYLRRRFLSELDVVGRLVLLGGAVTWVCADAVPSATVRMRTGANRAYLNVDMAELMTDLSAMTLPNLPIRESTNILPISRSNSSIRRFVDFLKSVS